MERREKRHSFTGLRCRKGKKFRGKVPKIEQTGKLHRRVPDTSNQKEGTGTKKKTNVVGTNIPVTKKTRQRTLLNQHTARNVLGQGGGEKLEDKKKKLGTSMLKNLPKKKTNSWCTGGRKDKKRRRSIKVP